jgi:hypothetical protein
MLLELDAWEPTCYPQFIADDDIAQVSQDPYLRDHLESWRQHAQLVALGGHCSILEDGPEVIDPESQEEEHGDSISIELSPQAQLIEQARVRGMAGDQDTSHGVSRQ